MKDLFIQARERITVVALLAILLTPLPLTAQRDTSSLSSSRDHWMLIDAMRLGDLPLPDSTQHYLTAFFAQRANDWQRAATPSSRVRFGLRHILSDGSSAVIWLGVDHFEFQAADGAYFARPDDPSIIRALEVLLAASAPHR